MHRFLCVKKLSVSHVNFSSGLGEGRYARTCTLCNRISWRPSFAGRISVPRVHSTRANLENNAYDISRVKKYKVMGKNVKKSQKKMKITVLDSIESGNHEMEPKSFITSSPSSPAFAGPKLAGVGVTIVLPPNSSDKVVKKFSNVNPLLNSSNQLLTDECKRQDVTVLSHAAAELVFGGLCRNKFLTESYSQPISESSPKPSATSFSSLLYHLKNDFKPESRTVEKPVRLQDSQSKGFLVATENQSEGSILTKKEKQTQELTNRLSASRLKSAQMKRLMRRAVYIDVCISTGKLQEADNYAVAGLKSFPNSPVRNILLEPLFCHAAQTGSCSQVIHLLSIAHQYNVSLSVSSYIVCFDLLGRIPSENNQRIIKMLLSNMKKEQVSLTDLVAACKNRHVLIKNILQAIQAFDPQSIESIKFQTDYHVDVLLPLQKLAEAKATRYYSPAEGVFSVDVSEKLVDDQIALQSSRVFRIKNIACEFSQSKLDELQEMQKKLEDEWRKTVKAGLINSLKSLQKETASFQLRCILECLPIEKYVDIIIEEAYARLDDSERQSIGVKCAYRNLGERVKEVYDLIVLKNYGISTNARDAHVKYCKWYFNPENYPEGPSNPREIWDSVTDAMKYDDASASFLLREWHPVLCTRVGKFLYSVLLKDVKIDENILSPRKGRHMVPALYVLFRKTTKGYQKQLKMHPAVHHIFSTKMQPVLCMNPCELPMVCPPRPWVSTSSGVYPISSPSLQRIPESEVGEEALAVNVESVPTHHLYPSLDSLNQLGSIPWRVNKPVLDVITEVFNSGGDKKLAIPQPPSAAEEVPASMQTGSLSERIAFSKKRTAVRQDNAAMYSLWCDTLYKLCIAHEFRDKVFWLPHNMDFRGRVYPVCPHLQHMSNDMARSMLVFAKGEKLGPDGLDWLKIHTVNLIGNMSKESIDARLAHANEVLPKILDSAEKPLTGDKWWMDSEYPWQTLAACTEIAAAIGSGDPENFVSHFPVHQDGSCNGLQHFAALGRDTLGAQAVNLIDTDKPSDVYMCVANSVEQQRAKAAENGDAVAKQLEGFICRKVVKQTVMTTVYGVTRYGAQLQIWGQLKDMDFPVEMIPAASAFIVKLVFLSLGEMFTSSRNTQDWLTQCADGIVKSKKMPVKWITPLGLPVVQPYFKKMTLIKQIEKSRDKDYINVTGNQVPSAQKHKNAFSPNFIHSLDSCHMILTGLYCEQANIPFISVHDCYWVHAKNIGQMSKICREQFVSLHSIPILENLSKFLIQTYCSEESSNINDVDAVEERRLRRLFSAVPPKGNFDLREVLSSKYFFS